MLLSSRFVQLRIAKVNPILLLTCSTFYVAPVMEDHVTEREVYLPDGTAWFNAWTGEKYEGGQKVTVAAPLDTIPVFVKEGADAEKLLNIFSE